MKGFLTLASMAAIWSAWAVAGITGNNTSEIILNLTSGNYQIILIVSTILYTTALGICIFLVSKKKFLTNQRIL